MTTAYSTHLGERLRERKISRDLVDKTVENPDRKEPSKGGLKLTKRFGTQTLTVITTRTQNGTNLVVSAWIDPPNPGTQDYKKRALYQSYKSASGLKKWWYAFRLALLG